METAAQPVPPGKKDKTQRILIVMIFVLAAFILVCVGLIAFIAITRGNADQPRPMTLRHPSGETVPGGLTQQDLEQAIQLAKESGAGMLKGNQDTLNRNLDQMGQLILAGRLVELENEVDCLLLESHGSMCRVRLTEGMRNGQTFWVPKDCVSRGGEPTMGFCCASIYVRFIVTGAACGATLYFMQLRSFTMQIFLFIIGMIILNLLWVRLAAMLTF